MKGVYWEQVESVDMVHLLPERDGFMNTILEVSLVLFTDTEAIIVSLDVTKCPVISNIKLAEFVGSAPVAVFIFDTNNLVIQHFPIATLLPYHLRPFTVRAGMGRATATDAQHQVDHLDVRCKCKIDIKMFEL